MVRKEFSKHISNGKSKFCFWWDWGFELRVCAWKAGALLLEQYFQSILLWLF
jgi:hypothetical protein